MERTSSGMQTFSTHTRKPSIQILSHHIYEYRKGLRHLVLHTMPSEDLPEAESILQRRGIDYWVQPINSLKVNLFFGEVRCLKIVQSFQQESLSDYTVEQDFILGILLGYSRMEQCDRYLSRQLEKEKSPAKIIRLNSEEEFVLQKTTL